MVTQLSDANTSAATSSFSYDSKGNIASITDVLGHRLEVLSYDIAGNPLTIKDYRGFLWYYHYDADEQFKSVTNPLGQITQYEYDTTNNLTAIVDEAGKKNYVEYDNEGRLLRVIDGAGNEIIHHYDQTPTQPVNSRVSVKIDYPTYSQLLSYDKLLRLTKITEVVNDDTQYTTHYQHDTEGNLKRYTDSQDNSTDYEYDALGRLVQVTDYNINFNQELVLALNKVFIMIKENITQNEDGRKNVTIRSKNNNFSITLNYDKNGQLEELWVYERHGFSTTCSAQYDGAGNLKSKHSFVYDSKEDIREYTTYDKDNRVKTRTVYEGKVDDVTFSKDFDGNGNLMHTTESFWEGNDIKSIYRDKDGNEIEEPPIEKSIAWWGEKPKDTNK